VGNRREFELMISYPEANSAMSINGVRLEQSPENVDPVTLKSLEHSQLCGREMAAFYRKTENGELPPAGPVEMPEISEGLQSELMDKCSAFIVGEPLPLSWIFTFTSAWVRVFGLVVMEAFGSLPVQDNVDEFYKTQILAMIREFGIDG